MRRSALSRMFFAALRSAWAAAPLPHRQHPGEQLQDAGAPGPAGQDTPGPERAAGRRGMTGQAPPFAARRTPVASLPASGAQRGKETRKDRSRTRTALPQKVCNFILTKVCSFKLTVTHATRSGLGFWLGVLRGQEVLGFGCVLIGLLRYRNFGRILSQAYGFRSATAIGVRFGQGMDQRRH